MCSPSRRARRGARSISAGDAVVQSLLPAVERHERAALDEIDPADIETLKQLLEKVYHNLCTLDTVLPVNTGERKKIVSRDFVAATSGSL